LNGIPVYPFSKNGERPYLAPPKTQFLAPIFGPNSCFPGQVRRRCGHGYCPVHAYNTPHLIFNILILTFMHSKGTSYTNTNPYAQI